MRTSNLKERKRESRWTGRGVCPRCRRPLKCSSYSPPTTSTWSCSSSACGYSVEMPKASRLYSRARLEFGDVPHGGAAARSAP